MEAVKHGSIEAYDVVYDSSDCVTPAAATLGEV